MIKTKNYNLVFYLSFFVIAFSLCFFNTALSPLYPDSYITHDASVFYVMGRAIKRGFVAYKDYFDHKGLYIYFAYAIASIIGETNHMGVWIVFSLFTFFYMIFVYKIINLFFLKFDKYKNDITKSNFIKFFATIIFGMFYTSIYYGNDAMFCEHIALLMIIISMYTVTKHLLYDETLFDKKNMFLQGILASVVLFDKPNYVLYFGAVLFICIYEHIVKNNIKNLIYNFIYGFLGLIVGALPVIIYCILTNSLSDMIFATFTINFSYVGNSKIDAIEKAPLEATINRYKVTVVLAITSIILLVKNKLNKKLDMFIIISFVLLLIVIIIPLRGYQHYLLMINPYMIYLFIIFLDGVYDIFIKNTSVIKKKISVGIVFLIYCILVYYVGAVSQDRNQYLSSVKAKKVVDIFNKEFPTKKMREEVKVNVIGYGTYFYNELDVLPGERYFYVPVMDYETFPDAFNAIRDSVYNFKNDIVITAENDLVHDTLGKDFHTFLDDNYDLLYVLDEKYSKIYRKRY